MYFPIQNKGFYYLSAISSVAFTYLSLLGFFFLKALCVVARRQCHWDSYHGNCFQSSFLHEEKRIGDLREYVCKCLLPTYMGIFMCSTELYGDLGKVTAGI